MNKPTLVIGEKSERLCPRCSSYLSYAEHLYDLGEGREVRHPVFACLICEKVWIDPAIQTLVA